MLGPRSEMKRDARREARSETARSSGVECVLLWSQYEVEWSGAMSSAPLSAQLQASNTMRHQQLCLQQQRPAAAETEQSNNQPTTLGQRTHSPST